MTPQDTEVPFDPDYDQSQNGHIPAQDFAAERSVLGAMMLNPDVCNEVLGMLRGRDYWRPEHETIHTAIEHLVAAGEPVDAVTVAATIGPKPLAKLGGALYVHDLTASVPIAANAAYYAGIVRDKARLRTLERTGEQLIRIARKGGDVESAYTLGYETLDAAAADYGPKTHIRTTWAPVDLTEVLAGGELDPPPVMFRRNDGECMFYAGAVHTISGESESGKTWFALWGAAQEMDNGKHIVFIDFEDRASRVIGRLMMLGVPEPTIRDQFHYVRPDRPLDDNGRAQLSPLLHSRTTLVIIDGVTESMTLHGLDINSNSDTAKYQDLLPRWIADHGPAVAMIDHVVKDEERQNRHAIGAQHKLAGIDGVAYIVKVRVPFGRGRRGEADIIVSKDRPGYVRGYALGGKKAAKFAIDGTFSDTRLVIEVSAPTDTHSESFTPTHFMEKISRYIQQTPGMSKASIESAVPGNAKTKRLALELLVAQGYVLSEKGKRGAIVHQHIKPYYQPSDDPEEGKGQ